MKNSQAGNTMDQLSSSQLDLMSLSSLAAIGVPSARGGGTGGGAGPERDELARDLAAGGGLSSATPVFTI